MVKVLKSFIEEDFSDETLIVVSNREPYIHKKTGSVIKVEMPAGGLVSAIDNVLNITGGIWIAWGSGSGDKEVVDKRNCIKVPQENPSYSLKRVWLSQKIIENYYHGYSNRVLWPLCHIALDRIYFRKRFWSDYKHANRAFAEAVLEEADDNPVIWIHDYHLCLTPKIIREKKPGLTIAHFWHIPWPDWSVLRVCPQSKEIIEGLLGNDLMGFQIPLFVKNFLSCVKECLDAKIDYRNSTVTYNGHITRLGVFPISIDYDDFDFMASSRRTVRLMRKIKDRYRLEDSYIGIGVDRLEYTKALIKRLQAIDLLLERNESLRKKFTFIQVAVHTRKKEPYHSYKQIVEEFISRINLKYSTKDWKPIIYIDTKIEHKDLVAYYRMSDIGVISSMYDGMNLVAKEYIASQVDKNGVLILSELTGAAEELHGAILVNPYDIEEFSNSLKKALRMSDEEKAGRLSVLQRHVRENDIYKWIQDILHDLLKISCMKRQECSYLLGHIDNIKDKLKRNKIFLFLDYDGTLTPIVESPDKAFISDTIRSLIVRLKRHIPIAIISGRSLADLKEKVGIDDIILAGNHGAEIWDGKKTVIDQQSLVNRKLIKEFINKLENTLSHIDGLFIEDKGVTASIHFRKMKTKNLPEFFDFFSKISVQYENSFKITSGKKVFEIRPIDAWNKGDAVEWILINKGKRKLPVYIGDDATDEDAFRKIRGKGINVCIGGSPEAEYYLKTQGEIKNFLQCLLKRLL